MQSANVSTMLQSVSSLQSAIAQQQASADRLTLLKATYQRLHKPCNVPTRRGDNMPPTVNDWQELAELYN